MLTTFYSYGTVAPRRQGEIIKELASPASRGSSAAEEVAAAVVRAMRKSGVPLT